LRILLVVNAFASSVTARNTVVVQRVLSQGNDVEMVETNRRGHATRFAQDAARRGIDVVIGFGGDGTLNEVANGVAGTETALGVLPGGSTNVFARTLGLPNDPSSAVRQLAAGIAAGSIDRVGLGTVNGRYFCFHTGIGYDAAVVRQVERRGSMKRWFGHPLFIQSALSTWMSGYDRRVPHFVVDSPGVAAVDGFFTVVLNTNPYTYLGNRPLDLSPAATLDRGLVAITFTRFTARALLGSLGGALRGGGVKPTKVLDLRTDLAELTVTSPAPAAGSARRPFPYQVDGDDLGDATSLRFEHHPDIVRLVRPAVWHPLNPSWGHEPTPAP
jgi:diacylglycerol kinase family enzyme